MRERCPTSVAGCLLQIAFASLLHATADTAVPLSRSSRKSFEPSTVSAAAQLARSESASGAGTEVPSRAMRWIKWSSRERFATQPWSPAAIAPTSAAASSQRTYKAQGAE